MGQTEEREPYRFYMFARARAYEVHSSRCAYRRNSSKYYSNTFSAQMFYLLFQTQKLAAKKKKDGSRYEQQPSVTSEMCWVSADTHTHTHTKEGMNDNFWRLFELDWEKKADDCEKKKDDDLYS